MKPIILLTLLCSCSVIQDVDDPPRYAIDAAFTADVQAFYDQCQARGIVYDRANLILQPLPEGWKDASGAYGFSRSYVVKQQRYAEVAIFQCQEMGVFRELAHALLSKPYSNGEVIMNPQADPCAYVHLPQGDYYADIRDKYLSELFTH